MRRLIPTLTVLVAAPATSGCGSESSVSTPAPPSDTAAALAELGQLNRYLRDEKLPHPRSVADLGQYDGALPNAYPLVQSGEVVVLWGTGSASGTAVLAFEKDVPTKGGKVLCQNGTVKDMTASEFASAPKAGK